MVIASDKEMDLKKEAPTISNIKAKVNEVTKSQENNKKSEVEDSAKSESENNKKSEVEDSTESESENNSSEEEVIPKKAAPRKASKADTPSESEEESEEEKNVKKTVKKPLKS